MHLMLCLSTLSTLVFALHQYQISLVSTVSTIWKAFHPVFEMFTQICIDSVNISPFFAVFNSTTSVPDACLVSTVSTIRILLKCSTQMCINSVNNPNAEFSTQICIDSVDISPFFAVFNSTMSVPDAF